MLTIGADGFVKDSRVKIVECQLIEHGPLGTIHGIIVHQTGSNTAKATISGYQNPDRPDGAHFLIDTDGTVYQTASILKKCWHVGQLRSRCLEEHTCDPKTKDKYDTYLKDGGWNYQKNMMKRDESNLPYPQRYPQNEDSIGIEIVSPVDHSLDRTKNGTPDHSRDAFVSITPDEQHALDWLIPQLLDSLHLTRRDIFRHSQVSYKLQSEGASAHY